MPIICYIPQINTSCPVQCFMKLLLCVTLIFFLLYLPFACVNRGDSSRSNQDNDKEVACHFCNLPNAIANIVGRILNLLCSRLPGSGGTQAPAAVIEPGKAKEKLKQVTTEIPKAVAKEIPKLPGYGETQAPAAAVPEKINEIPKHVTTEIPKAVAKEVPKVKEKKKICEKLSGLFKKCKYRKSKEKICPPTCKMSVKAEKSKSEPNLDQPTSDMALSGSCARCVENKTPCPHNCPNAKR